METASGANESAVIAVLTPLTCPVIAAPFVDEPEGPVGESEPEALPHATDVASAPIPIAKRSQRDFVFVITTPIPRSSPLWPDTGKRRFQMAAVGIAQIDRDVAVTRHIAIC